MKRVLTTIAAFVLLTSCYEAHYGTTNHPNETKLEVGVTAEEMDAIKPFDGTMTLLIGDKSYEVETDATYLVPDLLSPKSYDCQLFSNHSESGAAAFKYDASTGDVIATLPVDAAGMLDKSANFLYYKGFDYTAVADRDDKIDVEAQLCGRLLCFVFTFTGDAADRVVSVDAEVTGVPDKWNYTQNSAVGSGVSVELPFAIEQSVDSDGKVVSVASSCVHLLGLVDGGTSPSITLDFSYLDGSPEDISVTIDLGDMVAEFNNSNESVVRVSAEIGTATQPVVSGVIVDWINDESAGELLAK